MMGLEKNSIHELSTKELYNNMKQAIKTKEAYEIFIKKELPYSMLLGDINNVSIPQKLDEIAYLKAHIYRSCSYTWFWGTIDIAIALIGILITYKVEDVPLVPIICILLIFVITVAGGVWRMFVYKKDQYLLAIVESVEAYFLALLKREDV